MPTTATIRTDQADIVVTTTSGTGLPLLMIHGSGLGKEVFARQLESPLAQRYRLVAMDLPGHGRSSDARDPTTGYTLRGLAAAVGAVIDTLGIRRIALFGWSLGGHIAIEVMMSHPAIAGLMLTGTPPVASGPLGTLRGFHTHWDLLLASKEHFTARDATRYHQLCFGGEDTEFLPAIRRADGRLRPIVFRSMMRGDGADQKRAVENARIPIAMVNGAHDPIVRLGYMSSLDYGCLWDNRCYVIAGAGHAPFWTASDRFNQLLGRFMDDVDSGRLIEQPLRARQA